MQIRYVKDPGGHRCFSLQGRVGGAKGYWASNVLTGRDILTLALVRGRFTLGPDIADLKGSKVLPGQLKQGWPV